METQRGKPRKYSFEFYPPKTAEGMAKLQGTVRQLAQLKPDFFSCTYGAGGSTREGTLATVLQIREAGHAGAPHLSCVASTKAELREVIEQYKAHGIRHIVALRGDLPSGLATSGEFRYASELVAYIRELTGDWFHIEVAAYPEYHPQARKPQQDLQAFKAKIDAGANAAITQYFYNPDAYFHFVEAAEAHPELGVQLAVFCLAEDTRIDLGERTAVLRYRPQPNVPRHCVAGMLATECRATMMRARCV